MENRLVTIFQDTQKLLWENEQIFHLTTSAVMCTRIFPEVFEDFYHYNNQMDYFYSDRIIYSENVTVFKTETKYPEYTDEWFDGGFKNTFREVVFAVNAEHLQGKRNLDIFKSILSPWQKNQLYGKKVSILGDSISIYGVPFDTYNKSG